MNRYLFYFIFLIPMITPKKNKNISGNIVDLNIRKKLCGFEFCNLSCSLFMQLL